MSCFKKGMYLTIASYKLMEGFMAQTEFNISLSRWQGNADHEIIWAT